jgi:hypothetical protein
MDQDLHDFDDKSERRDLSDPQPNASNSRPKTGRANLGTTPSKKRVQGICQAISEATRRNKTQQAFEQLVAQLNRQLIGWANYFCLGPVWKAA